MFKSSYRKSKALKYCIGNGRCRTICKLAMEMNESSTSEYNRSRRNEIALALLHGKRQPLVVWEVKDIEILIFASKGV